MNNMYLYFFIIIIFLIIIFVLINKMTIKKNNILNAKSSLDVMLKKRFDLIPNLVEIVKANTKHEKDVLTNLVNLRNRGLETDDDRDKLNINNEINNELKNIFVLAEDNPSLKSNLTFLKLQTILNDVEDEISAGRRTYNAHVTDYNNFIAIIPVNIIAFIFRFKKYDLFKINDEEKDNKKWMNENG